MQLLDLLHALEHVVIKGKLDIDVKSITSDSRKVTSQGMFICIEGYNTDGHSFIQSAIDNGASVIVLQKDMIITDDITVIKVKDTRYSIAHIANTFYGAPSFDFKLVGVTGTKGKTTTTYMIKSILEQNSMKVGSIGTISYQVGDNVYKSERTTPEPCLLQELFNEMKQVNVDSVVMEVSSHALELSRVAFCDFDIGVFTNLSQDHLDFHLNYENYLNSKLKLFDISKLGVVNIDSEYGKKVYKKAKCKMYSFGISSEADLRATDIVTKSDCVTFKVASKWVNGKVKVNIPGVFSVYNAIAAISVCALMGVPFSIIKKGLAKVRVPGRAELVETGRDFTVVVDYAHSPASLENILCTVGGYAKGRVISIFGCGGDRDKTKRPIMGKISSELADFTIVTSDNPRTEEPEKIIKDIEQGMVNSPERYVTITDRKEAIKYSIENAQSGDVIVIAGKGHENYQIFKDKVIHFDDREVVKEVLNEMM